MAAAAVGRRGGKARARRGGGRCDLIIGDGGHGAGAGKLGLASGSLVTGAQQERDDDKARQQRGAALAHKGQGDAGQRDQAGYAANDQEGLEADGGRKACGTKGGEVGFSAGSCGEATHGKEHKQDEHGAAAQKAHLLADSREDKVGLDDRDVVGHAVADANTDQTAIGKLGRSIQNTIIIPLLALVVIVLLAVLIAYLVVRRRNALTNVVDILSMIPYIVPGTVLGIALLIGFNKPPLLISGTMLIMVVALIIRRLPYTIRSSVAILQQIPMSIEEAAISLGASKMKAFFRITVPMMASGIISGAILSWVTMISELSTAIILYTGKTKTLTVAIYTEVIRGNYGTAAALSTIMTILTVISLLAFSKLNGGKDISL